MKKTLTALALSLVITTAQAALIDFDDNVLAPDSFFDPQASVTWTSGGASFNHGWNFGCCWDGITYSNKTDTTTPGFLNDRSAITGDGVGAGQDNYAVVYTGGAAPTMRFSGPRTVLGGYFTNTTYAYLAMANGDDGNDPAFVSGPFGADDFFELTIRGLDAGGEELSFVTYNLATGGDVIDTWEYFDLTGLGEVYALDFSLASSDVGMFGMNTPAYFAMDSISIVPVPPAVWLFGSALLAIGARRAKA